MNTKFIIVWFFVGVSVGATVMIIPLKSTLENEKQKSYQQGYLDRSSGCVWSTIGCYPSHSRDAITCTKENKYMGTFFVRNAEIYDSALFPIENMTVHDLISGKW